MNKYGLGSRNPIKKKYGFGDSLKNVVNFRALDLLRSKFFITPASDRKLSAAKTISLVRYVREEKFFPNLVSVVSGK